MKEYDATELAYKKGYVKGYEDGKRDAVKHGHMVERIVDHECPWYKVYDCSECGCSVEIWHNFCPNCGAKMYGGVKNE